MDDAAKRLEDPDFQRLLKKRSRWRWGMSTLLIGCYLIYSIAGVYLDTVFAATVPGTSLPWGLAIGFVLIFASIILSIVYVQAINRLEAEQTNTRGGE